MAVNPTGSDMKAFLVDNPDEPVVMLNLLRFAEGGADRYDEYIAHFRTDCGEGRREHPLLRARGRRRGCRAGAGMGRRTPRLLPEPAGLLRHGARPRLPGGDPPAHRGAHRGGPAADGPSLRRIGSGSSGSASGAAGRRRGARGTTGRFACPNSSGSSSRGRDTPYQPDVRRGLAERGDRVRADRRAGDDERGRVAGVQHTAGGRGGVVAGDGDDRAVGEVEQARQPGVGGLEDLELGARAAWCARRRRWPWCARGRSGRRPRSARPRRPAAPGGRPPRRRPGRRCSTPCRAAWRAPVEPGAGHRGAGDTGLLRERRDRRPRRPTTSS